MREMVLGTLLYIIIIIAIIIIIIALLKFLFQLFFIGPIGVEGWDFYIDKYVLLLKPASLLVVSVIFVQ
jgi:hypothetical protein